LDLLTLINICLLEEDMYKREGIDYRDRSLRWFLRLFGPILEDKLRYRVRVFKDMPI